MRPLAQVLGSATGQPLGGIGYSAHRNTLAPVDRQEVAAFETETQVVTSLGLSSERLLGVPVRTNRHSTSDPNGCDLVVERYELPAVVPASAHAELVEARRRVSELCRPLADQDLIRELFRTRMLMSRSAQSDADFDLIVEAYADELKVYPADIVIDALRTVARMNQWWPSWAELLEIVERRARPRRALVAALNELVKRAMLANVTAGAA